MLAAAFDPLRRLFLHPQLAWIALWIGLAFLIVALAIMIRTSWGQSRPLSKCAALSLLAHLLLAGYATTVEIVTASTGLQRGSVDVVFVDGSPDGVDDPFADPAAPWTTGAAGEVDDPSIAALARDKSVPVATTVRPTEGVPTLPAPPPLLDVPLPHPPLPVVDIADVKPQPEPAEPIDETPPGEKTADAVKPQLVEPPTPELPATERVADATAVDANKATVPLPPIIAADLLPTLPLPPTTSDITDWVSGDPAGAAVPGQPVPEGPQNDARDKPASGDRVANSTTRDGANGAAPAVGPIVETAAAPIAARAVPEIYADRMAPDHGAVSRARGGSPEAESAVQAALHWLAANQSSDGRWDAARFGAGRETGVLGHDRQGAGAKADSAVTGLALLAFLGAGNTHMQGDYPKTVQRGLEYLLSIQAPDGNLAGNSETFAFMYSHGMATLAMSEAYAMTRDKRLEPAVQSAINYTLRAQIRSTGGWRYRSVELPAERGDTSQLGWQLMALKSAELAGINVPQSTTDGAVRFLKSVSSGPAGGKASYRPGERPSRTMTAEALVCRQFLGMARDNPASNEAGDYLLSEPPSAERINLYYWYYATLGMYQLQGDHWQRWNQSLQPTLINRQRADGDLAGSWDPDCLWAGYGGRVYSTAMSALCLEVYYRYLPIYRMAGRTSLDATK